MPKSYDAIIIGAGHNGLVTAARLAQTGWKVLVLERRPVIGGCCVTEELWPGYKVSTAAYVNSLLRPEIIRDLELKKYGFSMLPRSPSSFTPFPDGRYLLMGPDAALTHREVSKFSTKDADNLPKYEQMLLRAAAFLEPMLMETPPDPWSNRPGDWWKLTRLAWKFRSLGRDGAQVIDILTSAASPILDRWFESEELKVTLATDAVIGAAAAPSMPGTAYVLFHHVMGECDGARGVWGYVRGGMGGISQAIAASAQAHGVDIRTDVAVERIVLRSGKVIGVALASGEEIAAPRIASCVDARTTFLKLLQPRDLPEEFVSAVQAIDYTSMTVKINVALDALPNFTAAPSTGVAPHHHGTIHIGPDRDYVERAYDEAKHGRPASHPMIECTLPTALDDSLAPPGKHLMGMFVQYVPPVGKGEWDADAFAQRCFDIVNDYAPNFKSAIQHYQVLPPAELERIYGLTGGNIMQGAMNLNALFFLRPVAGYANYRTPVPGLYLCGAAAHPGGGVMGAAGWNAAREMLRDGRP
ncbi:MAG TPA: NAD(P)/FAD-dependent oxidoreductase [Gemmatales bacterium]|nr:NAD(P)/FAD-dependent oxidoreductase [Gemmatales bacterium]HMP59902.1 NAD(P)/FAD-dependent oxidoreductase [Gemmatales bacterium]